MDSTERISLDSILKRNLALGEEVIQFSGRLRAIGDRLEGSVPSPERAPGSINARPSSLLFQLDDSQSAIRATLDAISHDLRRLEEIVQPAPKSEPTGGYTQDSRAQAGLTRALR